MDRGFLPVEGRKILDKNPEVRYLSYRSRTYFLQPTIITPPCSSYRLMWIFG